MKKMKNKKPSGKNKLTRNSVCVMILLLDDYQKHSGCRGHLYCNSRKNESQQKNERAVVMKNKEKVTELIAALKAEAENEFELHRISVLEKDLLEGMPKVEVIDEKHQKFKGNVYRLNSGGHFERTEQIHRSLYEYYNGQIELGFHIHHKDFKKENNEIENLQMLTNSDHRKLHSTIGAEQTYRKEKYICSICGQEFEAFVRGKKKTTNFHYCSDKCRAEMIYKTRYEERLCAYCGKKFITFKYGKTKYCSHKCATLFGADKKKKENKNVKMKICEHCGKTYVAKKDTQKYCSRNCLAKANYSRKLATVIRKRQKFVCKNCGREYEAFYNGGKNYFCSKKCCKMFHRKNKNVE